METLSVIRVFVKRYSGIIVWAVCGRSIAECFADELADYSERR